MPPLPKLRVPLLSELEKELRFAPREAIVRDIERVEALAPELDPGQSYPADWIVFRITGYRSASAEDGAPTLIPGAALLADLSSFAEHLGIAGKLAREDELARGGVTSPALLARWSVSRATLNRLRRLGLVARRTTTPRGTSALVFSKTVVERFERDHRSRLELAGAFTRIEPAGARRMIRQAARYERCLGYSLIESARRLAQRHGRSVEGVRALLARERADEPAGGRVLDGRVRRVLLRASDRGIDVATLARRYSRSPASVRRALTLAGVERLQELVPGAQGHDRASNAGKGKRASTARDAASPTLAPRSVHGGLGARGERDLKAFLESARAEMASDATIERERLAAMRFLVADSARRLRDVDLAHPSPAELDEVETRLRWAARLKGELVRPQLRLVLETIESRLGRRVESIRPALIAPLLRAALAASAGAIDGIDPGRGGRVAAGVGLAVDRAVLAWSRTHLAELSVASPRRAEVILPAGIVIRDWTRALAPWQRGVEPPERVRDSVEGGALKDADAAWLADRFGWRGTPPLTLAQLAARDRTSPARSAIRERALLRSALRSAEPAR